MGSAVITSASAMVVSDAIRKRIWNLLRAKTARYRSIADERHELADSLGIEGRRSGLPSSNHEIGTAAAIYPDPALVKSPAIALGAAGVAPLFHELHAVSRIGRTVISPAVIG